MQVMLPCCAKSLPPCHGPELPLQQPCASKSILHNLKRYMWMSCFSI